MFGLANETIVKVMVERLLGKFHTSACSTVPPAALADPAALAEPVPTRA